MTADRFPFSFPLAQEDIADKRAAIYAQLCADDADFRAIPIRSLHPATLGNMLRMYDTLFFDGFLCKKLSMLRIACSGRLTSSAGKFVCTKGPFGSIKDAEIRMSSDFFLRLERGPFHLNGLTAATPQEAFLIVFEHELCHALEAALYRKTGHSKRFLSLAFGLFGHTAARHSLPTRRQDAAACGFQVGARAAFTTQGTRHTGIITYIGKTATVMVPSSCGVYRDSRGNRYAKYRVPLHKLTRI